MIRFLARFAIFGLATFFVCRGVVLISGTNTLGTAVGPILIALAVVSGVFFALVSPKKREDELVIERWDDPGSARLGTQFAATPPAERGELYSGPDRRKGAGRGSAARASAAARETATAGS